MHTKSIVSLAALAIVAGSAFAADPSAPLTRDQVRQSVVAARAAGQLQAAGPAYDGPAPYDKSAAYSQFTRAEVRHEVAVARADGQLAPAGEAGDSVFTLLPAGEDVDGAARTSTVRTASAAKPSLFSSLSKTSGTTAK